MTYTDDTASCNNVPSAVTCVCVCVCVCMFVEYLLLMTGTHRVSPHDDGSTTDLEIKKYRLEQPPP